MRSRGWRRISCWACCASATGCTRARESRTTTSLSAGRSDFVTRRITRGAAAIALGLQQELTLGDLGAVRDWSFAGDIVRGAWLMLQQEEPDDYVLASGVAHTVAELAQAAFACVQLDAERYLRVDEALVRVPETHAERG